MNGERQWWMSRILYILAVNYDRKHLKNSKIGLEYSFKTPGIFFFQMSKNPACVLSTFIHMSWQPTLVFCMTPSNNGIRLLLCYCSAVYGTVDWLCEQPGESWHLTLHLLAQESVPWCRCAGILERFLYKGCCASVSQFCWLSAAKWSC